MVTIGRFLKYYTVVNLTQNKKSCNSQQLYVYLGTFAITTTHKETGKPRPRYNQCMTSYSLHISLFLLYLFADVKRDISQILEDLQMIPLRAVKIGHRMVGYPTRSNVKNFK